MSGSWRKILFALLTLAVLAALIIYSRGAMHQQFNWPRLARALKAARLSYLILSVGAMFAAYAIRALRWQVFCRSLGRCSFWNVYNGTLMGYAGLFLLGRAGEPIRPLLLARKCRFTISSMFGIWLLERLFDLTATAVLLGLSLLLPSRLLATGEGAEWQIKFRATGGLLLAGMAGLLALVVYFRVHGAGALDRRLAGWRARGGWRSRLAMQFGGFIEGLQAIRSVGDLLLSVAYSAAHWGLIAVVYLWIARSFGGRLAEIDLRGALLVLIFTLIGSTVQLPGVGGGTQVLAFIAFTQIFAIEQEPAAAAAIVLWLISFAAVAAVGVPLLIHEGWSMADLRRLARSEAKSESAGTHLSAAADASTGRTAAPEADGGGDLPR